MERAILVIVAAVAVTAAGIWGYRFYEDSQHYVSTDNALVTGNLVQVSPANAGRVAAIDVDVGDAVRRGQKLASLAVPVSSSLGLSAASAGPIQGTEINSDLMAPVNGVVVAKPVSVGDRVASGQPVLSLIDVGQLWVMANVNEGDVRRVKVGQPVEVSVDMVDRTFEGKVIAITPATAATFFPPQLSNATGDYTKVTQLVPVKISVDYAGSTLIPGASAEVKIKVT